MNMPDSDETHRSPETAADDLQQIPGVGKSIAEDLRGLGYHCVADLRGEDPEEMYDRYSFEHSAPADRCLLYVFRCAVYYASTEDPDRELLKWWNWKDREQPR